MLALARELAIPSALSEPDPVVVELAALWRTDPRPPPSWTTCLSGVMPRPLDMVGAGVPSLELSRTTEGRGMGATGTGAGTEPGEKYQYMEIKLHYNSYLASSHPAGWGWLVGFWSDLELFLCRVAGSPS